MRISAVSQICKILKFPHRKSCPDLQNPLHLQKPRSAKTQRFLRSAKSLTSADLQICKIPYIFGSKFFSKSVNWVSHLQTSDLQNSLQKVCRFLRSAKFLTKGLQICRFLQICKLSESAELSDLLNSLQKVNRFLRSAKILTKGLQICWFLLICQLSEFAELPDLQNSLQKVSRFLISAKILTKGQQISQICTSANFLTFYLNLPICRSELTYNRVVD